MMQFMGFPRADGSAGIRNHIVIIGMDLQGVSAGQKAVRLVKDTLLILYNRESKDIVQKALGHPNVAGIVVVGEEQEDEETSGLTSHLERTGKPHGVVSVKGLGPIDALSTTLITVTNIMRDVSTQRRELTRLSKLIPALSCPQNRPAIKPLEAFIQVFLEDNGRCLFVGHGDTKAFGFGPSIKENVKGTVKPGKGPKSDSGIYFYPRPDRTDELWKTMVAWGVQVLIHHPASGAPLCHPLIPTVNLIVDSDAEPKRLCDLDLSTLNKDGFEPRDAGLLLLNETLATASGKLTSHEIPADRILWL